MTKKILIVEDEIALSQVLSDKFLQEGFDVKTAGDGQEGLEAIQSWKPDVVLLDIVMPRMDGMTMLHKLRETPDGKRLPVILLTNLSDTENVYEAMANGVYDFLVKSHWDINELVHEVQTKLLDNRS
ncbi:MAG TPA: response regulator [Candidatus Saccharimonadales bacterium]|nr:response regulator [Candidatus Saccharimonadales bacterium]